MLHILNDSLLPDHLLDLALGFDVVGIRVENLPGETSSTSPRATHPTCAPLTSICRCFSRSRGFPDPPIPPRVCCVNLANPSGSDSMVLAISGFSCREGGIGRGLASHHPEPIDSLSTYTSHLFHHLRVSEKHQSPAFHVVGHVAWC
jgi:hypothetical protein